MLSFVDLLPPAAGLAEPLRLDSLPSASNLVSMTFVAPPSAVTFSYIPPTTYKFGHILGYVFPKFIQGFDGWVMLYPNIF